MEISLPALKIYLNMMTVAGCGDSNAMTVTRDNSNFSEGTQV
jgi:hypothetical protein